MKVMNPCLEIVFITFRCKCLFMSVMFWRESGLQDIKLSLFMCVCLQPSQILPVCTCLVCGASWVWSGRSYWLSILIDIAKNLPTSPSSVTFKYTHTRAHRETSIQTYNILGCYHLKWTRNTQRQQGESESFRVFSISVYDISVSLFLRLSVQAVCCRSC